MNGSLDVLSNFRNVAGDDPDQPYVLVNVADATGDPESIASKIYQVPITHEIVHPNAVYEKPLWLTAMSSCSTSALRAVDSEGNLHSFDHGRWAVHPVADGTFLNAVCAPTENSSFIVGDDGLLAVVDAEQIEVTRDPDNRSFFSVGHNAGGVTLAVGSQGAVWSLRGRSWSEMASPTSRSLYAVTPLGESSFYVGGADGSLFRLSGLDWSTVLCPRDATFTSLVSLEGKVYAAAGEHGVFVISNDTVEPLSPLSADTLAVVGRRLFASGPGFVGYWTGDGWWGGDLNIRSAE